MTLRVGLVQLRTPATQEAALAHAEPLVREAAAAGAQFILTPEGTNILQRDRAQLLSRLTSAEDDVAVRGLRALAAGLGVWLGIGSALVLDGDRPVNRQLLVSPSGEIAAAYDNWIGLALASLALVYLLLVLIFPERF